MTSNVNALLMNTLRVYGRVSLNIALEYLLCYRYFRNAKTRHEKHLVGIASLAFAAFGYVGRFLALNKNVT